MSTASAERSGQALHVTGHSSAISPVKKLLSASSKLTTASTTSPQPYSETTQAEHSALWSTHSDPGGV